MIKINLEKAKEIAHSIRRDMREQEFKPLDEIIMKQIPGRSFEEIESERQKIRDKYKELQILIDSSETPEQLKAVISNG